MNARHSKGTRKYTHIFCFSVVAVFCFVSSPKNIEVTGKRKVKAWQPENKRKYSKKKKIRKEKRIIRRKIGALKILKSEAKKKKIQFQNAF